MFFEVLLLAVLFFWLYCNISPPTVNNTNGSTSNSLSQRRRSSRDLPLPLMSENDKIRFINRAIVDDVMTEVLKGVVNCLFSKKYCNYSFKDYLIEKGASKKKLKSGFIEPYLKKKSCEDLDVTALTTILREGIKTLIPDGKDKSECLKSVKTVRDLRNSVMHQPNAAAIAKESQYQIQESLNILLDVTGSASGMDECDVKRIKNTIPEQIKQQIRLTDTRKKLIHSTSIFRVNGKEESRRFWKQYCQRGMPFDHERVQLKDVFYPLNVKDVDEYGHEKVESFKACIKIPSQRKVTIVEADAGAGKTTVMKFIGLMFYGLIEGIHIEALNCYDLLHFFECGDTTSSTLKEYIQNTYPNTCQDLDVEDILLSFGILNNLFIIDAYDERNERSNRVIIELIARMKRWKTCNFIFTMRSYAISSFIQLLQRENIDFNHFQIEGLCDKNEQIAFLQRLDSKQETPDLIKSFEKLDPHLTDFFRFPVNLTYYRSLFRASPETVKKWRVDSDVLDDMYNLFMVLIEKKIDSTCINYSSDVILRVLEEVNDLALRYLLINRVVIQKKDFEQLKADCKNKINENLPYGQMLSNIFISKTSPLPNADVKFQFLHKSVQEYFASKALVKRLRTENCNNPITILINLEKEEREKKSSPLPATLAQKPVLGEEYYNFLHSDSSASKKVFAKFEKLLAFVINELRKQDSPSKTLIKNIVKLLPGESRIEINNFYYWDRLLRLCKYDETVLEIVSNEVTWDAANTSTLSDCKTCPALLFSSLDEKIYFHDLFIVAPRAIAEYGNIKDLLKKLVEVQYDGRLRLILEHSYEHLVPCDDIVMNLDGSKSKLIEFKGCLSEIKALNVLAKSSIQMANLKIAVPDQHSLDFSPLRESKVQLYLQVPFLREVDQNPFKLPNTKHPANVSINGVPRRSWHAAAQMIIAIAPENKTFGSIEIVNAMMEDEDVNSLVKELEANNLATDLDLMDTKWDKVKKVGKVLPCIRLYPSQRSI